MPKALNYFGYVISTVDLVSVAHSTTSRMDCSIDYDFLRTFHAMADYR